VKSTDADVRSTAAKPPLDSAEYLDVHTKRHGWKLEVKALEQLDEAVARKPDVDDNRQAGLDIYPRWEAAEPVQAARQQSSRRASDHYRHGLE
jgi:hypothetical protein